MCRQNNYRILQALALTVLCASTVNTAQCDAQTAGNQFTAGQGTAGSQNAQTSGNYYGDSGATVQQDVPWVASHPVTTSMPFPGTNYAPGNLALKVNGWAPFLPITNMDSFVYQAGGQRYDIYDDEGTFGPPPLFGFEENNEIESGIKADRASGLTTGHYRGSDQMPSSWGWTMRP